MSTKSPGRTARAASVRRTVARHITASCLAIAAAFLTFASARAVTIDWVTVGDPGNAADDTGYGAVAYEYKIGKYEITIGQYANFLNAAAKSDPYGLYKADMGSNLYIAGISRSGSSGAYTYSVMTAAGIAPYGGVSNANRPITYVSWFDVARFANWMHNGQGNGSTETGAYTLVGGQVSGEAPARNPGAQFYLPTANEWYKAAYYKGSGTNAGYWEYATQSDAVPGNFIGSGTNQANWRLNGTTYSVTRSNTYSASQNYLTDVGTFSGSPSKYGTFDQSGNVMEWNDSPPLIDGAGNNVRGVRGGSAGYEADLMAASTDFWSSTSSEYNSIGFRLASPVAVPEPSTYAMALAGLAYGGFSMWRRRKRSPRGQSLSATTASCLAVAVAFTSLAPADATPITIDWVTVGDPGNAADTTGYGAVATAFQIGKYEVTIGQYAAFLNAAAKSDPYSLYSTSMATDLNSAGISRTGASGSYTYSVIGPAGSTPAGASSPGNRPIAYVSWFDAARFANWMHNGQGSGSTETGAYTLNGATSGTAPARNAGGQFYLPTENQWYKAAYYKGGGTNAGYWDYATQSDTDPGNTIGSAANQANYINSVYSVTRSSSYSSGQNYLTEVGAYTNSQSAYGTFDQSGNVMEWNDLTGAAGTSRGLRGGGWDWNGAISLSSPFRVTDATSADSYFIGNGFRLASPVAVPEPSTWVMGLAGIACAGWRAVRRRTRGRGGRSLTVKVSPNLLAGGMRRKLPIGGISASLALVRTKSVREKSPRRRLFAPSSFRFFVATCGILAAELLSSGPADAGSIAIAVPTAAATTTGSSSWGFGYYGSQQVAQNLFPSSELVGMNVGDTILGLTIRSPYFPFPGSSFSPYTFPQFDISVGRGKASLGSVFADNFHSPPTTVRTGSLTVGQGFFQGPLNFGTMISFDTPYVYSGGNLLIELRTKSAQIGFDADLMVAGQTSGQLAYAFGSTSATNATGIENYNFAMQLNVSPVPEPSTWAMGLAGLAYGGFSLWRRRKAKAALAVALVSLAVAGSEPALAGPVSGPMADVVFGNLGASGNNALGGLSTSAIDAGPDGTRIAVSFVTGSDGPWTLGSLRLGIGSPTNDPVPFALITGDDGGTPSLSTVAAFYSIPGEGSSITTTGFYDFTPTFAAELQASTTYWLFVGNDSPEASSFGWYGNAAAASPTAQNDSGWSFGATKISFDGGSTWGGYSAGNSVAFSIAAVPEPSTYALTLAGIACAGWHVTRRQKRLAKKVTATKSGWLCRCRGLQSV